MSLDIKEVIQIARAQFKELLPELAIDSTGTNQRRPFPEVLLRRHSP